ncbi:unnamed protein product [Rhizophagus irregularis]|nr:unnamed protein product [Rhizophagus irregularis]
MFTTEGLAIPRSPGVKPTLRLARSPCEEFFPSQQQDIKRVGICRSPANFPVKPLVTGENNYAMSETSTPYTPASTSTTVAGNETVSLADEIRKYKTKELINFLREEEDLELSDKVFEIL